MNLFLVFLLVFITYLQIIFASNETTILQQKSPGLMFCTANREIRIVSLNESLLSGKPTIYKKRIRRFARRSRPQIPKSRRSESQGICENDIDYDLLDNYVVWSNTSSIIVAPLDKKYKNALNINSKKVLLKATEVQKVSLDWIHDLLYYIENGEIKVISVKNQRIKTITDNQQLNNNYYNAIDVAVNPIDSFIVWLLWDRRTYNFKIMKADQSGTNQKILADLGTYGYDYRNLNPCCLSIDYESKRIYFIDNKQQTLESLSFNGTERLTHLRSTLFTLTSSLDVYGNDVFWANRGEFNILSTNKNGKSDNIRAILKSEYSIDSIRIIHISKQPETENRCKSSKCQNLCIPGANDQYVCVCDDQNKRLNRNDCREAIYIVNNMTIKDKDKRAEEMIIEPKVNEIEVTENSARSYPLYVFRCLMNLDEKTNESFRADFVANDNRRLIDKYQRSPIGRNISRRGNSIEMKVRYPYIKALNTFKCKTSNGNESFETIYKVNVRQLPSNPRILSHSLSFAGISKVYLTLQIENTKIDPPIDKYRVVYRGIFNYYQQEYWVDFNALTMNESDKNTIYIVKLDLDYTRQDLMAFKIYAHNDVGWSYPLFN